MPESGFSDAFCSFIQDTIPTLEAVEVVVFLSRHRDRGYTAQEIVDAIRPTILAEPTARKYLTLMTARGALAEEPGDRFRYRAASADVEEKVQELIKMYNERPVTLIRVIYSLRDRRIRSFADAFKIKEDQE